MTDYAAIPVPGGVDGETVIFKKSAIYMMEDVSWLADTEKNVHGVLLLTNYRLLFHAEDSVFF